MSEEISTDDVIVNEEVAVETPVETTGDVTTETPSEEVTTEETPVAEQDDYWKNRAHEYERKVSNLTDNIPKMIEETLIKQGSNKTEEKEYTIAELEAYKLENPEHAPWVEEEKAKLQEKRFKRLLNAEKEEQKKVSAKQQSELRVLSNSKYAEAFVQTPTGQKVFNEQSPLARAMHGYMQDPAMQGRSDALEIAAKLAYADMVDQGLQAKDAKLTTLKREAAVLKQKTMVEGGGVNNVAPTQDAYTQATSRLRQSGNRNDAESAVKEYFRKIRK